VNTDAKQTRLRFLIWMGIYAVTIFAGGYFLPKPPRLDTTHVVGALIPMIPLVFAGLASLSFTRSMDELERRIQVEGLLFAVVLLSITILSVGLLQWIAALPTFSIGWLWPVLCTFYGLGTFIARRRYA
jgi:hypothetical protein